MRPIRPVSLADRSDAVRTGEINPVELERRRRTHAAREAESRAKAKRRRRRLVRLAVVAIIVVAAVAAGGFYLFQKSSIAGERDLNRAIELVQESDDLIVDIDQAVDENVTADTVDDYQALVDEAPAIDEKLSQALDYANAATAANMSAEKGSVAQSVVDDITARRDMIAAGTQILSADVSAYNAATSLAEAWDLIIEADTLSRNAASAMQGVDSTTIDAALETATNDYNQALTDLDDAQAALDTAAQQMPSADFSTLTDYVSAKKAAINAAMNADQTAKNGTTDEQEAAVQAYSDADAAAVTAASNIPHDPSQIITDAYKNLTSSMHSSFDEARQRVVKNDVALRDYLGVSVTSSTDTSDASTASASSTASDVSTTSDALTTSISSSTAEA
jgi:hypothetical protein